LNNGRKSEERYKVFQGSQQAKMSHWKTYQIERMRKHPKNKKSILKRRESKASCLRENRS
jgi:hypothetical protein